MDKKIVRIPKKAAIESKKIRASIYARVSTLKENQAGSLQLQQEYFIQYIRSKKDWELVDIYFDEGISGVRMTNRSGFNRMLDDTRKGKFDYIVTKSISRFARNTVDTINTIRELKGLNIGVYFEKENINTLDDEGEFILTLLASFAQEESRSLSEKIKWALRKRNLRGEFSLAYSRFLGYDKGNENNLKKNAKEAKIIECIFSLSVIGYSPSQIKYFLETKGIKSVLGNNHWNVSTIKSILQNEKYKGDALLQKSFRPDFKSKKRKKNEGEVEQYYIENSHEAIVTNDLFENVNFKKNRSNHHTLKGKLICTECQSDYIFYLMHPELNGGKSTWCCRNKQLNKCNSSYVYDKKIREVLVDLCIEKYLKNPYLKTIKTKPLGKRKFKFYKVDYQSLTVDVADIVKKIKIDSNGDCEIEFIFGRKRKGKLKVSK